MEFEAIVGLGGFAVMLAMVLAGVPIFVTLLTVTFGGMAILLHGDMTMLLQQFKSAPFAIAASYQFAVLPLFMLLGVLAGETGVGKGAYDAVAKWTNRKAGIFKDYFIIGPSPWDFMEGDMANLLERLQPTTPDRVRNYHRLMEAQAAQENKEDYQQDEKSKSRHHQKKPLIVVPGYSKN